MEALRNAKYNWYPYKVQSAQLEQNSNYFLWFYAVIWSNAFSF